MFLIDKYSGLDLNKCTGLELNVDVDWDYLANVNSY